MAAKKEAKLVHVIPYVCRLPPSCTNADALRSRFTRDNVGQNLVEYGGDMLAMVVDRTEGPFVFGRLLRLRKSAPEILNYTTGNERVVDIDPDSEAVKETSHFILNTAESVLLGEYNHYGARHFSLPLVTYLRKVFGLDDDAIAVDQILDKDTFARMSRERVIKKVCVQVAKRSLRGKEELLGFSVLGALLNVVRDDDSMVTIEISKSRKADRRLDHDEVKQYTKKIKEAIPELRGLYVEGMQSKYDLLNNNILRWTDEVSTRNDKVESDSFYTAARVLYDAHIDEIRECLRTD
jgi:hypothetical protein